MLCVQVHQSELRKILIKMCWLLCGCLLILCAESNSLNKIPQDILSPNFNHGCFKCKKKKRFYVMEEYLRLYLSCVHRLEYKYLNVWTCKKGKHLFESVCVYDPSIVWRRICKVQGCLFQRGQVSTSLICGLFHFNTLSPNPPKPPPNSPPTSHSIMS